MGPPGLLIFLGVCISFTLEWSCGAGHMHLMALSKFHLFLLTLCILFVCALEYRLFPLLRAFRMILWYIIVSFPSIIVQYILHICKSYFSFGFVVSLSLWACSYLGFPGAQYAFPSKWQGVLLFPWPVKCFFPLKLEFISSLNPVWIPAFPAYCSRLDCRM
jgi:hypothetical protein